ncbi:hypothetical protein D3C77_448230 [compost metagenome]
MPWLTCQVVENQQSAHCRQRRHIEGGLYRHCQHAGELARQRSRTDTAHHAAREQGETVCAARRLYPLGDQNRPEGIERAPAKTKDQTAEHQTSTGSGHQGKAQARCNQAQRGEGDGPRRPPTISQMTTAKYSDHGAKHRQGDDPPGILLIATTATDQQ